MHNSFINKAEELNRKNIPYAVAMVVRRKIPSSGKPGDKAIITKEGEMYGWIGGGCTKGIVLKEALLALKDGKPRYVSIGSDTGSHHFDDTKLYTMTCQSGGEVELYIEPVTVKPTILIFGGSHIGMALCKIAKAMQYNVITIQNQVDKVVFPSSDRWISLSEFDPKEFYQDLFFPVVCTQGEGDKESLEKALKLNADYLSFVASKRKANSIFTDLRKSGISVKMLKRIKTPAGLDIGAKLPEEVAVSILAEIIEFFRKSKVEKESTDSNGEELKSFPNEDYYVNPVCNIPIQKSTAKHVLEYQGEKVYFCCDGCKISFEKDPQKYISSS